MSTKFLNKELIHSMESAGLQVAHVDFIKKTIRVPDHLDPHSICPIVALTSKTALHAWIKIAEHLGLNINHYKVYCLDAATQTLCVQYGLSIAGVAKDASSLAEVILKDKSIMEITFVCGNLRREELPNKLKEQGIIVHEIEAYHTQPCSIKIEQSYQGVLFFSPSAVDSFLSLNPINSSVAFCLGKTTAGYARKVGYEETCVAETPTPESLVNAVLNYYNNQTIHA